LLQFPPVLIDQFFEFLILMMCAMSSPGGEVSTPKNDDSVLGVRGFNQMHRWASRQSELHAENRRLRDQTKAFTELVAAYEHQLQSLKLVVRLRVEENEKLRHLSGDRSVDDKALHALQTQLETLQQELVAVRQSAELPPAAIDWCLRFMLLQDTVETRAPWILLGHNEEEDASQFRVPPAVQQQLAQERARNEELANEVRALADKFLKLKAEQDANFTSSPDRLWRSLPDAFKNQVIRLICFRVSFRFSFILCFGLMIYQIHEVREGHAAKTTMTVKLDKAKDEINALKIRVREFDELRAELDSVPHCGHLACLLTRQWSHVCVDLLQVRFEAERAKTAHQKEMSSTRKENEARIERLIEEYTAKIQVLINYHHSMW
jgi:curved DNA-binding protein CbpA